MKAMRFLSVFLVALGLTLGGGLVAAPGSWLVPNEVYTFSGLAGQVLTLPSAGYPEWSVFNGQSAAVEAGVNYSVLGDGEVAGYEAGALRFGAALAEDTAAYLSLGIRGNEAGDALEMVPNPGRLRLDELFFKVRFVASDEPPKMSTLQRMYESYAASLPDSETGDQQAGLAAKLGLCVLSDGYFYLTRVRAGSSAEDSGEGTPESFLFEFCKTPVLYADVGEGAVVVRVLFKSYQDLQGAIVSRAYQVYVLNAADYHEDDDSLNDWKCLTTKLGYRWMIDEQTNDYAFDFSSLEQADDCSWFYPIDNSMAAQGSAVSGEGLDALNQLGFSSTDGAFYSAWLKVGQEAQGANVLGSYALGAFEPFVASEGRLFGLYAEWAGRYGVTLSDYLQGGTSQAGVLSADDLSEEAFNAFLLNMDPAKSAEQVLSVTGVVTGKETITLTVFGPEGCDLGQVKAAKICVRRSETPTGLRDATPVYYGVSRSVAGGGVVLVLPREELSSTGEGRELPFMKVTLVPVSEAVETFAE